ncbi:MAG TPA: tetratricopeptide repeat protein, partial [Polyangiaceae bacterium]|nr:tetratricopeptide repeat protein [Polyangiaceae bacterium]
TAGEKAMRDGDLEEAQQKLAGAATLDEKDPRVARAQARLAVLHAELAWLELRVSPADDAGRDAVKRRFEDVGKRAVAAADRAASLGDATKPDAELAPVLVDVKRIGGDLDGAKKAASALDPGSSSTDVGIALAALDLAEDNPDYDKAIALLQKAAAEEGGMGRARSLLVYAFGRKGDGKKAREELDRLSKLAKAHPLEAELKRFVERVEKGESVALNVTDLPTLPTTAAPTASGAAPEGGDVSARTAQEALQHGQLDLAEGIYQKMVDRDASSVEGLSGLAAVARSRGQTKRAISIYERVVAAAPTNVGAVMALADLKWDSGDRSGGATMYRRALDLGVTGSSADRAHDRTGSGTLPTSTATAGTTSGGATSAAPTATAAPPPTSDSTSGGAPPPGPSTTGGGDVPPWEGAP